MSRFPHLDDSRFPNIETVNAYKFDNDYDYSQFDNPQMKITLCHVPWDMGEVHVGQAVVSGIGNVVHFGNETLRDKWFSAIPDDQCVRFSTEYRKLHTDNFIDIELPFDVAVLYNYIAVEYPPIANSHHLVAHESTHEGIKKWFWFVREIERLANNTTRFHILPDTWQTFIYRFPISQMLLERGHMPMFQTSVDSYLSNPVKNSKMLLSEDVNYSTPRIARKSSEFLINGKDVVAVIVTSADPTGNFGTKAANTWNTPNGYTQQHGVPSYHAFYVATSNLNTFITNMTSQAPQFAQTIKAVFFVNKSLCNSGASFTFCDVLCTWVSNTYTNHMFYKLNKSDFGFDSKYEGIAKLYTYPYSVLEVADETGSITEIRIEDTDGTLKIETAYSLVFPWIRLDAHLTGIGASAKKTLTWYDVGTRHMDIAGNWYDQLRSWSIPTFGITQSASVTNDYETHFERAQMDVQGTNAQLNADAIANTTTANAALQAAANTANNTANISKLNSENTENVNYQTLVEGYQESYNTQSANDQVALATQTASISQATNAWSAATGAIGSLMTLDIGGAVSSVVNGAVNAWATGAQLEANVGYTRITAGRTNIFNQAGRIAANDNMTALNGYVVTNENAHTTNANALTTGTAANSAATQISNAARDKATNDSAIANQVKQAALNAPSEFGAFADGEHATTRPQGLFCNVVTQPDGAIAQAGDEMLRYGYYLNQMIDFSSWHFGKFFTYWKVRDFWCDDNTVPDLYADRLRYFLLGGVTVWQNPSDIGKRTIYDNI